MLTLTQPSTTRILPSPAAVAGMIGNLVGKRVLARETLDRIFKTGDLVSFGLFADPKKRIRSLWLSDWDFSVYASCALTMAPPKVAEEIRKSNTLSDEYKANLHEVYNVLSALINGVGDMHLVLTDSFVAKAPLPNGWQGAINTARQSLLLVVNIPGYGEGKTAVYDL